MARRSQPQGADPQLPWWWWCCAPHTCTHTAGSRPPHHSLAPALAPQHAGSCCNTKKAKSATGQGETNVLWKDAGVTFLVSQLSCQADNADGVLSSSASPKFLRQTVQEPSPGIWSRWRGLEGTPYICWELWLTKSCLPDSSISVQKMPLAWVKHHVPKQLPLQMQRQGIISLAPAGNFRALAVTDWSLSIQPTTHQSFCDTFLL